VPPNWSKHDWFEEVVALAAAAACQAAFNFDASRGVPLTAFTYQRVLSACLTRYRQEWAYGRRCADHLAGEPLAGITAGMVAAGDIQELLSLAIAGLPDSDRLLLTRIFWEGCTEAELSRVLGISHQAVSKRKLAVLRSLRAWLDPPE
jgi:DNA-directed RNA polymerase specialized sigma24 family protein